MDTSDYIPLFVAECREYVSGVTLALLAIEAGSAESSSTELSRLVHSLKGMCATMGYELLAQLMHDLEDVLEIVQDDIHTERAVALQVSLETMDALEAALTRLESVGDVDVDLSELVVRLRTIGVTAAGTDAESEPAPVSAPAPLPGSDTSQPVHVPVQSVPIDRDLTRLWIEVRLSDSTAMRAPRALTVLSAAERLGRIAAARPTHDAVSTFEGLVIELELDTNVAPAGVVAHLEGLPDVIGVVARSSGADATSITSTPGASGPGHPLRRASDGQRSVRVDAARLDELMHLMGEVVVDRTQLEAVAGRAESSELNASLQSLIRSTQALQAIVMQVRMVPLEAVFLRFPRMVRDLAARLGKPVDFVLEGAETEVDRSIVDAVFDPVAHIVRNALDHGIEDLDERRRAGKPDSATLRLYARTGAGRVIVGVADDGGGINVPAIARKAIGLGLLPPSSGEHLDLEDAIELLFHPGFSTAAATTDISGRGVGLDAVREAVRAIGGTVNVISEPGVGTRVEIHLPLTLAIVPVLLAGAPHGTIALPTERIARIVPLRDVVTRNAGQGRVVVIEGSVIPLVSVASITGGVPGGENYAVVVRSGSREIALAVPQVFGSRELVARALPGTLAATGMFSGGGQLADGEIALIIDCDALPSVLVPQRTEGAA